MTDTSAYTVLLLGVFVLITIAMKPLFEKGGIPPLIGYLLLGFLFNWADIRFGVFTQFSRDIFGFLGKISLVMLLFRVGLTSNLKALLAKLSTASLVGLADVFGSGAVGFLVMKFVLNQNLITSLVVATAFTATSVGISVGVWENADAMNSDQGRLLIDVAEFDDITGVILMALLFAIIPVLQHHEAASVGLVAVKTLAVFWLKLLIFGFGCYLFSTYLEERMTNFFKRLESFPDITIMVVGAGILIAAIAGLMGFSIAIGAFFAGLVFSRDHKAMEMETTLVPTYDLFTPFFFIDIGLQIAPGVITVAIGLGLVLSLAAILTKFVFNGLMVWVLTDWISGLMIGASMIPRAEISMVIMKKGIEAGNKIVSDRIFGAMVMVTAVTSICSPLVVRKLIKMWPPKELR